MPKKPPSVPLSAVAVVLETEGIGAAQRQRILAALERSIPKRGHPLTDDAALLAEATALMSTGKRAYSASVQVTRSLPESSREAARKRIYGKAKKIEEENQQPTPPRNLATGSGAPPYQPDSPAQRVKELAEKMKKAGPSYK
jgi:hypothetical protein